MYESEQKNSEQRVPAYKKFGSAKLVPPPAPIPQLNEQQTFPVFLGVGIALSIAALITVFVLAFFSHKTKVNTVPSPGAVPTEISASATPSQSPAKTGL